jgi:hypothetical protein
MLINVSIETLVPVTRLERGLTEATVAFQDNRCSPVAVSRAMRINDTVSKTTETKIKATRA